MEPTKLYDYVMDQLGKTQLSLPQVAAGSGESKSTVEKIFRKQIIDPGVSHCEALATFFQELAAMPGANQREQFKAMMAKREARAA